jgi:hypothetical protein
MTIPSMGKCIQFATHLDSFPSQMAEGASLFRPTETLNAIRDRPQ